MYVRASCTEVSLFQAKIIVDVVQIPQSFRLVFQNICCLLYSKDMLKAARLRAQDERRSSRLVRPNGSGLEIPCLTRGSEVTDTEGFLAECNRSRRKASRSQHASHKTKDTIALDVVSTQRRQLYTEEQSLLCSFTGPLMAPFLEIYVALRQNAAAWLSFLLFKLQIFSRDPAQHLASCSLVQN